MHKIIYFYKTSSPLAEEEPPGQHEVILENGLKIITIYNFLKP
jgi:hypothetical protein